MALNPGQQQVSSAEARFRVVIAGRRWGKTYLAIRELARSVREPGHRAFYVAPTYRQAKQIVWDQLKARLSALQWIKRVNESDLTVTLKNDSTISLRGADNPDSLRGVGLDFVCMDEFAMIDEKAWTEVLRPTLSDRRGQAMFISTPMGQANWAYDLYQRGQDPTEHAWESFQYTTLAGGNVDADEIAQAEQDLDERTFRQEYLATFETYANRVFYAFERAHNLRHRPDINTQVISIGMDFNIDPMSAVIAVTGPEECDIIDEIEMFSSNTTEMIEEIRSRYPKSRIIVYPDPASRQRKTSAGGATDLSLLTNAGFTVKAPNSHNPVRDGVNAVNSRLCAGTGDSAHRRLFIDPRCRRTIEALEKHSYKTGSSQPDKGSGYDHMSDALRYLIDYVYPVRREVEYSAPQRWGHRI